MRRLLNKLKRSFRRLLGLCTLCGAKLATKNPTDIHTQGPFCRYCNKMVGHGLLYGMSGARAKEQFTR